MSKTTVTVQNYDDMKAVEATLTTPSVFACTQSPLWFCWCVDSNTVLTFVSDTGKPSSFDTDFPSAIIMSNTITFS